MKEYSKEENFLSVILLVHNNEKSIVEKINNLNDVLEHNFKNYEIVVVDNFSSDQTLDKLNSMDSKMTIVELSRKHNTQQALISGVDICIGDFIVEIEDISSIENFDMIMDIYRTSLQGYDFVFYSPKKAKYTSKIFYLLINNYFKKRLNAAINSTIMVLSSRRGQNKTSETGNVIANRNISYLLSGLNYKVIYTDLRKTNNRGFLENIDLFVDTLIHYTDLIPKAATFISMFFASISGLFLIYSFIFYFTIGTVEGWASTNTFLAFSFTGIFLMFAFVSKYLLNILSISKKTKQYTFKSVIKKLK